MTLSPTWVIAFTDPSITYGVKLAGVADTSAAPWSAFTAVAGATARPAEASTDATTALAARQTTDMCMRAPPDRQAPHDDRCAAERSPHRPGAGRTLRKTLALRKFLRRQVLRPEPGLRRSRPGPCCSERCCSWHSRLRC